MIHPSSPRNLAAIVAALLAALIFAALFLALFGLALWVTA